MTDLTITQGFSSTTAQVLDFIITRLASGRYTPGQRLNAASICKELSLSKAPVREALHVLAGEGVVDMTKNRGAFIRELTEADLIGLWELVAVTYGRQIRSAARSAVHPGCIQRLSVAMESVREERQLGPSLRFYQALNRFHDVVAELSDNPFLVSAQTRRLVEFWLPYIMRSLPLDLYMDTYLSNYQRIFDAIVAGDGRTAESAFHYHSRWSAALIRGERPPPQGPWIDGSDSI